MTTNVTNVNTTVEDNTVLGVMYLSISVLVLSCNTVVILVIISMRELQLAALRNLFFMAIFDFLTGFYFLITVVPSAFLNRFAFTDRAIGWTASVGTFLNGQNILNIVLSVLDRYVYIRWPMNYIQIVTMKRFIIALLTTITVNILRTCLIVFPEMDFYYNSVIALCVSDFNGLLGTLTSIIFTGGCFGTILFCLINIIVDLYRTQYRVSPIQTEHPRRILRFSFTIAVTAGMLCLSYLPFIIAIVFNFTVGRDNIPTGFLKFSMVALQANSLWNVIIYATTYKPFRATLLRVACKRYYRRQMQLEAQVVPITDTNLRY